MSLEEAADAFCTALRRRQVEGSLPSAKRTATLLRLLLTTRRHADAQALLDDVRAWGVRLQAAKPSELAIGNVVRRVLHMVREEALAEDVGEAPAQASPAAQAAEPEAREARGPGLLSKMLRPLGGRTVSLHNLLDQSAPAAQPKPAAQQPAAPAARPAAARQSPEPARPPASEAAESVADEGERSRRRRTPNWRGKAEVLEQVNELIAELDGVGASIATQALDHMHANEVILTFGHSNTTQLFLIEAAKKREFQVVAAEGAPEFGGHRLARALAEAGINTTAIADSAIFAMMARANKVLMGAHALLANGGVMAPAGAQLVALAAKHHSVPFVVLAGLHKLSPLFPDDPAVSFNDLKSPAGIADYSVVAAAADGGAEAGAAGGGGEVFVHVPNPTLDYVPPELISLLVTDTGGHTPSYVYRLLAEYYSREDYSLAPDLLPAGDAGR